MSVRIDPGARPEGTVNEHEAGANVRQMFEEIAPTYDRANHLLSMGLDGMWWRRAARSFAEVLARPDARVLDLCCGTGDMTAALLRLRPAGEGVAPIIGLDFSTAMLVRARAKYAHANAVWEQGDAMHLAYPDGTMDLVTSAFGFRNLVSYRGGLAEIFRVLRPGGRIGILDCNQPGGIAGALYNLYFKRVLPIAGGLISGRPAAYRYLPASVERFPRPPQMLQWMAEAGFERARWTGYTLGTAGLYRGTKP